MARIIRISQGEAFKPKNEIIVDAPVRTDYQYPTDTVPIEARRVPGAHLLKRQNHVLFGFTLCVSRTKSPAHR